MPKVKVSTKGAGNIGYCKICASSIAKEINDQLKVGNTQRAVIAWAAEQGLSVSVPTMRSHLRHITDQKTTFVENAQSHPAISRITQDEFLRTIVDIGGHKINEDPGAVTINQALRAASILEARREKDQSAINVLVLALSGNIPKNVTPAAIATTPLLEE